VKKGVVGEFFKTQARERSNGVNQQGENRDEVKKEEESTHRDLGGFVVGAQALVKGA
jgi:hypothetical protein